ncbi:hypothetical protein CK203_054030 [Vitis vinifera]|uniref:Uncharacterized protein n=1 Tax=Vitis vinifera TaxID=29760 RepID=A0A438GIK9_VITVI|nr:hypothetical protein CK203_054030 [Vitis vinifera]
MAALLYFEEKVHKKKLQEANAIPLLFPRPAVLDFGAPGVSNRASVGAQAHLREVFTLDKWNNMTTYRVEQPERPQPAARRASPRHILRVYLLLLLPSPEPLQSLQLITAIHFS